jgi:diguanylate cyclase (GGDEF)-like protein/PAS domain S-box-containing protein
LKKIWSNIPIRKVIVIVFAIAMLVSISVIGWLIFSNWFSSARQTTEDFAKGLNEYIYDQIYSYLQMPEQINEAHYKIIANGILNLTDKKNRERFFVGALDSCGKKIYSFSCGTLNGEYYGARRNENGVIEIMINNATTGGNSWYYSVSEDLTAGELIVQAGKFDPRTRDWYQVAVAKDEPSFSPIYKHFIMDDLTISHARPIYDTDGTFMGVLGTHMLLDDLGAYLLKTTSKYDGYAVIIEKESSYLVANSMGADNFKVSQDGSLDRHDLSTVGDWEVDAIYAQYNTSHKPSFLHKGKDSSHYVNVREIQLAGLDWVVISAIPEDYLMVPTIGTIYKAVLFAVFFLLLSIFVYIIMIRRLLRPMHTLLQTTGAFAAGDLAKRANVVRNDEIGEISQSFNKVAGKMQFLVNGLEDTVRERTMQLRQTNAALEESKEQLRLILDSSAEGIYGVDEQGRLTFCNKSGIQMLGYTRQEELLGKNMHWQIHHSYRDGTIFPIKDCKIFKTFTNGDASYVDDEVFWRADGTPFDVEYYSFPQVKDGEIIGAVVTFMDISERKQKEAEIQYLSCYDTLTGLYNRGCFEKHRADADIPDNLPLSVIFADINGLKMTNDIFGHAAGDELIKKAAKILQQACRQGDIIARVGGDEFIMLLPKTVKEDALEILKRIKSNFAGVVVRAIRCSISLGVDTKLNPEQSLEEIIANAENAMYKDKTMNRKSINKDIIDTIVETLHAKSPLEKQHSINVGKLSAQIGAVLQLGETEISKLNKAGFLHDIGKIVLDDRFLVDGYLNEDEIERVQQHVATGYRILSLFDETLALAEYVYAHHERWDGTGYPRGLQGEQIPFLARIIAVAEVYDRIMQKDEYSIKDRKKMAWEAIKKGAGTQFDPQVVDAFAKVLKAAVSQDVPESR